MLIGKLNRYLTSTMSIKTAKFVWADKMWKGNEIFAKVDDFLLCSLDTFWLRSFDILDNVAASLPKKRVNSSHWNSANTSEKQVYFYCKHEKVFHKITLILHSSDSLPTKISKISNFYSQKKINDDVDEGQPRREFHSELVGRFFFSSYEKSTNIVIWTGERSQLGRLWFFFSSQSRSTLLFAPSTIVHGVEQIIKVTKSVEW